MLERLLVLDLTRHLPGPFATQVLADAGARVIKVEAPGGGDPVRAWPPHDADGVSVSFRALNQGKPSLALDLKQEAARALLLRLVERADVLVEGFRPGVMARLGLGPEVCRARNPRLVYCSLSGYGQDGPYRDRPGHDLNYMAYSGALWVTADREGAPVVPGVQVGDMLGAYAALTGVLVALLAREQTGQGQVVDASMLDALVSMQGLHLLPHRAGAPARPGGMPLSGGFPCYRVYRAACGRHVALAALEPKFWDVFCDIVGREEWVSRQFDPALHEDVAALFAARSRDEWRLILEDAGCCLAPVLDYDEVAADPQVEARGLVGPERLGSPFRLEPGPMRGSEGSPVARRPGEHTDAVLSELLGLGPDELEGLRREGAIA